MWRTDAFPLEGKYCPERNGERDSPRMSADFLTEKTALPQFSPVNTVGLS